MGYNKKMLTDKEKKIIEGIFKKNEKTIFLFYHQHRKKLLNFIIRQVNNKQDAEEILQDSFLSFLEALRDFRGQSSLKTFLFSITKKKIIDHIRKNRIKKILFSTLPESLVNGFKTVLIDDDLEKKELRQKIKKVFKKLPNDYQVVLRLKYIEGVRVKKIAKKLSMSFKATESLIFRARKAFIKIFNLLP